MENKFQRVQAVFVLCMVFVVVGFLWATLGRSETLPSPTPSASPSIGLKNGYVPFYEPIEKIIPGKKDARKKTQSAMGVSAKETFTDTRGVDLSSVDAPILSQIRGDCTTHAMATAVENLVRRNGDRSADYSQASLWAWQNGVMNVDAAAKAAKGNFVKEEKGWAYGKAMTKPEIPGRYKVTGLTYLGDEDTANIGKKIMTALDNGMPLVWGGSVSKDMSACYKNIRPVTSHTSGGHSVGIVGYKVVEGELWMKLKNHWSSQCGDKGYQWLSLSSCKRGYCLWSALSEVEDKVTGKKYSALKPTPSPTPEMPQLISVNGQEFMCTKVKK